MFSWTSRLPAGRPRPLRRRPRPKAVNKTEKKPEKDVSAPAKPAAPAETKDSKNDDCRTPPPFDMLDIPGAMKKMGFPVAAKLAQRWLGGDFAIYTELKKIKLQKSIKFSLN